MTIYELLNGGELASLVIGRRRFIPAGAITAFIATSTTNIAPSQRPAFRRYRAVEVTPRLEPPRARSRPRGRAARHV